MKLGCPTTRTMVRTWGWMTCTVGGFETLLTSPLGSPWQPGAAREARRPSASGRRAPRPTETVDRLEGRIGDLRGAGRRARATAPEAFPGSGGERCFRMSGRLLRVGARRPLRLGDRRLLRVGVGEAEGGAQVVDRVVGDHIVP